MKKITLSAVLLLSTIFASAQCPAGQPLPLSEGFEGSFPPSTWSRYNPDSNESWEAANNAGGHGLTSNSATRDIFNDGSNTSGQSDFLYTPGMDFSSGSSPLNLYFDVAYAYYDNSFFDSLIVLVSTDCGNSWNRLYAKGKGSLQTASPTTSSFVPNSSQWRTETVNLDSYIGQSNIQIAFEVKSGWGNNLYLDNVSVGGCSNTLSFTSHPQNKYICAGASTSFSVSANNVQSYQWQTSTNGTTWNNISDNSIYSNTNSATLNINSAPTSISYNYYRCNLQNTCSDFMASNSARIEVSGIFDVVGLPFIEDFEGFFGSNGWLGWTIVNPNNNETWQQGSTGGFGNSSNSASRMINLDADDTGGQLDYLYSPIFDLNVSESQVNLSFDVAHAKYSNSFLDTLKVLASIDCGTTWSVLYSKGGDELSTAGTQTSSFIPNSSQWRKETVSLNSYIGQSVRLAFVTRSGWGNNIYFDNVNLVACSGIPSQPATITGNDIVCQNSSGVEYSVVPVDGAESYLWTVPSGASIVSGQGEPTVFVDFGSSSGEISVSVINGCGSSSPLSKSVTILTGAPSQPGTMTGLGTVCANAAGLLYSIAPVAGADSYTWTVPAGASITAGQGTTDVTVTWNSSSGTISVVAENACGISTARNKAISIGTTKPATPSSITGPTSSCEYGTSAVPYSCPLVSGASSYQWAVPSGVTILSGQGTNNITVSFGSGFTTNGPITVSAVNDCGASTAKSKQVYEVPKNPGVISGPKDICVSGLTGNNYSVSSAIVQGGPVTYNWTMPAGATLVSGQGTMNIVVNFASNFTQAVIKCAATNACGSSSASSITVGYIPKLPGISGLSTVCPNSTNNYTATGLVSATNYAWTVPVGATINSGQGTATISVTFGATAGKITCVASNACGSSGTKSYTVGLATCKDGGIFASDDDSEEVVEDINTDELKLSVYPNPATKGTMINLNVQGLTGQDQIATINVYDMIGKIVHTENLSIQNNAPVMLSNELNSGLFFIEIQIENKTIRQKLIVNK